MNVRMIPPEHDRTKIFLCNSEVVCECDCAGVRCLLIWTFPMDSPPLQTPLAMDVGPLKLPLDTQPLATSVEHTSSGRQDTSGNQATSPEAMFLIGMGKQGRTSRGRDDGTGVLFVRLEYLCRGRGSSMPLAPGCYTSRPKPPASLVTTQAAGTLGAQHIAQLCFRGDIHGWGRNLQFALVETVEFTELLVQLRNRGLVSRRAVQKEARYLMIGTPRKSFVLSKRIKLSRFPSRSRFSPWTLSVGISLCAAREEPTYKPRRDLSNLHCRGLRRDRHPVPTDVLLANGKSQDLSKGNASPSRAKLVEIRTHRLTQFQSLARALSARFLSCKLPSRINYDTATTISRLNNTDSLQAQS
ncbi:hypothetical protein B0H65DRAFT_445488 [Neurospora tetraspora]|uniref:Uncharacterized protein n=1 Tax=Neurospora tetraspora TaxID=94610 RepID=A0AAE0J9T5_9PEZI|nr:hypothetical protein B0H65DRAFT_445488 [Neurospora tetraspora]